MAKEIGKGNGKGFGNEKWNTWNNYLWKLMKIGRKGRWKVTGYMWEGKWRKIMENEENIGHINKKVSKD